MSKSNVRTLGMVSPKGTGKTSLVEAILFNAKALKRLGRVEDGNTASDFDAEEISRGMSLSPTVCSINYKGKRLHLLDTAGYPDFFGETRGVIPAVDNAVMLVSAADGVKSQAAKSWALCEEYNLPRFVIINEMDKELADFDAAYNSLRTVFEGAAFAPITVPMVQDKKFVGVIDLVKMKAYTYEGDSFSEGDIPDAYSDLVENYKEKLVETVAEMDDDLTEQYLDTGELSAEQVEQGLQKGAVSAQLIPVFAGAVTQNVGVAQFMDAFLDLSAAPEDRPDVECKDADGNEITRKPHANEPFSAMVFKTMVDQYAGKISVFRVVSGTLKPDTQVIDTTQDRKGRITQIYLVTGKQQEQATELVPGDIGAVVKMDDFCTGDTICDPTSKCVLPKLKFPESVLALAIQPKERGDEDKLSLGLSRLQDEDPLLQLQRDEQTKELTICGPGQVHLDVVVNRLKSRFAVDVSVSTPKVPYRETITKTVRAQGRHKKQTGGRGQFGDVWLELVPLERDAGFEFENKIFGGSVPRNFIPAVEKGVVQRMKRGVIAGYPLVDIKAIIYDGSYHSVDSSDMAFQIAGSLAMQKGTLEASPTLLEPIMNVEIEVPDECMGDIIGDVNSRRGRVSTVDQGLGVKIIKASVPMSEMLRYGPDLDSMTSGRGTYTMDLARYEEVPKKIAQDIVDAYQKQKAEEED